MKPAHSLARWRNDHGEPAPHQSLIVDGPDLVDDDDVVVRQRGDRLRLAHEPLARVVVVGQALADTTEAKDGLAGDVSRLQSDVET